MPGCVALVIADVSVVVPLDFSSDTLLNFHSTKMSCFQSAEIEHHCLQFNNKINANFPTISVKFQDGTNGIAIAHPALSRILLSNQLEDHPSTEVRVYLCLPTLFGNIKEWNGIFFTCIPLAKDQSFLDEGRDLWAASPIDKMMEKFVSPFLSGWLVPVRASCAGTILRTVAECRREWKD